MPLGDKFLYGALVPVICKYLPVFQRSISEIKRGPKIKQIWTTDAPDAHWTNLCMEPKCLYVPTSVSNMNFLA